jgi:TM2 domain-containing membrane protein YozV
MISGIAARSAITEARTQPEKVDSQAFLSREQPGGPSHPGEPDTKDCPYCGEQILAVARKCKHCSEFLDETIRPQQQIEATTTVHLHQHPQVNKDSWSPGVAAVLSLVIPGAGQMYKGQIGSGFVWLVGVTLGYLLMIAPGLILHILCVVMAATVKTK